MNSMGKYTESQDTQSNVVSENNLASDLLDINPKNTKLFEDEEIARSIFTVRKFEKQYYVMLGKYRLTDGFETKEEAIKDSERNDVLRIMQLAEIVYNSREEQKLKEEKK